MTLKPAVYIIANRRNGTIYTGVTSNLPNRIYQHKNKIISGFASRYNCNKLVYFEYYEDILNAIIREKNIKSVGRSKKIKLIEKSNPYWNDLYNSII